jgi:FkbM family methyltransferase
MDTLLTAAYWMIGITAAAATVWGVAVLRKWWRRSRFREYGWKVQRFELADDGVIEFAQWQHPKERTKLFSQAQVNALREFVRPGDTAIDVGAYTGDTALPLALAAGSTGCVFALEPNRYVYKVLEQNASLNPEKTHIVPLNFAATPEDGTFTFHYGDGSFCNGGFVSQLANPHHGHAYKLEVTGKDLAKYLRRKYPERLPRLALIKIDAEGYDRVVIHALRGLIAEHRPAIICEVYKKLDPTERETLFDVLADLGYDCFKLGDETGLRGEPVDRSGMTRWKHFDLISLPRQAKQKAAA